MQVLSSSYVRFLKPFWSSKWFTNAAMVGLFLGGLTGCSTYDDVSDWLFDTQNPPLPGERLSVLSLEQDLVVDPRLNREAVILPAPYLNENWSQNGGAPSHALHHLGVTSDVLAIQWRASIGAGSDSDLRLISMPVVANGIVFAMDAESRVVAMDAKTGKRIWRVSLVPEGESDDNSLGGGVAWYQGRVYATTGFGEIYALDAQTGALVWRTDIGQPFRMPPTVSNGAVVAASFDNQLHVLRAESGEVVWNHSGVEENADVMGGASPAISKGRVVAAFSSGDLTAFDLRSGAVVWQDSLVRRGRLTALQSLADINALPIVDRGMVFAVGHSGRMIAVDLQSGVRLWDAEIGGIQTPWVVGDYIYVLTNDSKMVALRREDGRIRWVTQLPQFENEERRRDQILWAGPLLVSDRLIVTSSLGEAWAISPYDGAVMGYEDLPDPTFLPPIVADGWVYILTDDGDIVALN